MEIQIITVKEGETMKAIAERKQYNPMSCLLDTAAFEHSWRVAKAFAASDLVPTHFRGKPENCFIAVQMALRSGVDIMAMLQSLYVVHGKPGLEAKLMIAMLNTSGRIKGAIRYKWDGKDSTRSCAAIVTDSETEKDVEGMAVTMAMAKAEGWIEKAGSKWKTMPDLMLQYRAAAFLIRTTYPDVIMGMQTREELDDMTPAQVQSTEFVDLPAVTKEAPKMPELSSPKQKPLDPNDPEAESRRQADLALENQDSEP
jgi:hypothetical protein